MDLNSDCIYLILAHMDLASLLNMVQTNKHLHSMVTHVLKYQYQVSSKALFIELSTPALLTANFWDKNLPKYEPPKFRFTENRFEIYEYEIALNFLKYFGYLIRTFVQSENSFYCERYEKIYQFINEYCHETLVDFNFNQNFPIDVMTKPFTNVKNIIYTSYWRTSEEPTFMSNEMFPALRSLTLTAFAFENIRSDCFLPHLEHFSVHVESNSSEVLDFLTLNSHIQSIEFSGNSETLSALARMNLPNFRNLTLWHMYIRTYLYHFDTVTTFTIKRAGIFRHNLRFTNLQEFNMNTFGFEYLPSWVEFFQNNTNIKRFNLKFNYWFNDSFDMIAPYLQNLEEMSISIIVKPKFNDGINATTIVNFIQHHEKLKRVELDLYDCNKDVEEMYEKSFSDEWIISNLVHGFSFKRKSTV